MSEELSPCPFCGGSAEHRLFRKNEHSVCCRRCKADCGGWKDPYLAKFKWNRRPAEEALKAEVEELAGYVKRFRETLAEVAKMALDAEQEQIFEKCRDALRDVYLEEEFRDKFDKILHNPDTEKGGEDE